MAYRIDLSQKADAMLLNRISYVFGVELTGADIKFHENKAQQHPPLVALELGDESFVRFDWQGRYEGQRYLNFTQADIQQLLGEDAAIVVPTDGPRRTDKLAGYIYDQLGVNIDPAEILIEYIPADARYWPLHIFRTHLALKGVIKVVYSDRRLSDLIIKTELDGFSKE